MPIAHIVIFLVLNMISIENVETFDNVILYFIPFIAVTVLGGIWGFNIAIRMLAPHYTSLKLPQKYFAFQLVLFFCKIQPIFLNILMKQVITTCEGPFTIVVKRHSEWTWLKSWKPIIIAFRCSCDSNPCTVWNVDAKHLGFLSLQRSLSRKKDWKRKRLRQLIFRTIVNWILLRFWEQHF